MVTISATLPSGSVESLDVDVVVEEKFDYAAVVTDSPVEVGSDVSDNIRPEPEKISVEVVVSNSPLVSPPVAIDPIRSTAAVTTLIRGQRLGGLLSYVTTLGTRSNLAVTNISVVKNAKNFGGARISLALKKIRIVSNKLTTIAVSKDPRVGAKVKTGNQGTPAPNYEQETQLQSEAGGMLQSLAPPQFSSVQ